MFEAIVLMITLNDSDSNSNYDDGNADIDNTTIISVTAGQ